MNFTARNRITIAGNFSRYAHLYDKYAGTQKFTALSLLKQAPDNSRKLILELGCGTGNYTLLLADKFNNARIQAVDISARMIELARAKLQNRNIEFCVGDAEKVDLRSGFDMVTSNACFQWFSNFEPALQKYKNLLNKNGIILFSIFGPNTFGELNAALKSAFGDIRIEADNFKEKNQLRDALMLNFKEVQIEEVIFTEKFSCLMELLRKIKYSGTSGRGLNNKISFNKKLLTKLEKIYLDKFGAICATYQVFLCRGAA